MEHSLFVRSEKATGLVHTKLCGVPLYLSDQLYLYRAEAQGKQLFVYFCGEESRAPSMRTLLAAYASCRATQRTTPCSLPAVSQLLLGELGYPLGIHCIFIMFTFHSNSETLV